MTQSECWLKGPHFLKTHENIWPLSEPITQLQDPETEVLREEKKNWNKLVLITTQQEPQKIFPVERWSTLIKTIRVVAYVLRFIEKVKNKSKTDNPQELSFAELLNAKETLLIDCQKYSFPNEYHALSDGKNLKKDSPLFKLTPILGKDSLMRVSSRLQMSTLSDEEINPIIIPKSHTGLLLARHTHKQHKHAGVNSMIVLLRSQYWIIGARNLCRKVKNECISCRRQESKAFSDIRAPLPEVRVKPTAPFSITGLDHGGPLYCCDMPGEKFYILLFTCAVTRALHFELVGSLSGEITYMAIRRFMARRGIPAIIMSDNAKGFESEKKKIVATFGTDGPSWKNIAPLSPWWGGWWERLIGSVKQALRKSIGKKNLTLVELETCLVEVEMVLNSRPLTFVGDNLDDGEVLTPSHFLIGRKVMSKSALSHDTHKSVDLVQKWEAQNDALDEFWSFWTLVYLRNLPPFKGSVSKNPLK